MEYLFPEITADIPEQDYHEEFSSLWFMPDKYLTLDVEYYVLSRVNTTEERGRIHHEMVLYRERNLEPLLRFVVYLVDFMREQKIVWGVGRGSSVSSFVLYVIGLNKINPLTYDLPIEEFLR